MLVSAQQSSSKTRHGKPKQASAIDCGTGLVAVQTTPQAADITVDGNFVGNAPATLRLSPGKHSVKVTAPNYGEWQRELAVLGGSESHLVVTLQKTESAVAASSPAPPPPPTSSTSTQPPAASAAPAPKLLRSNVAPWVPFPTNIPRPGVMAWRSPALLRVAPPPKPACRSGISSLPSMARMFSPSKISAPNSASTSRAPRSSCATAATLRWTKPPSFSTSSAERAFLPSRASRTLPETWPHSAARPTRNVSQLPTPRGSTCPSS